MNGKMLGRLTRHGDKFTCGCCNHSHDKRWWKRSERRQWKREAEA